MATFMDVHNGFIGVTAQQLKEAHERDLAIDDLNYESDFMSRSARPRVSLASVE